MSEPTVVPMARPPQTQAERARQLMTAATLASLEVADLALAAAAKAAADLQIASELLSHSPALRDRVGRLAATLDIELASIIAMRLRSGQ